MRIIEVVVTINSDQELLDLLEFTVSHVLPAAEPEPEAVEPEPEPEVVEDLKPARRKRRTKAEMEAAKAGDPVETVGSEPECKPEPVRRRRRAVPEEEGITDQDLTKAASQTAEYLSQHDKDGPAEVMELMEEFGVTNVKDIPQAQRQEFLNFLKADIEAAG